jgi:hypothetical protein
MFEEPRDLNFGRIRSSLSSDSEFESESRLGEAGQHALPDDEIGKVSRHAFTFSLVSVPSVCEWGAMERFFKIGGGLMS